MATFNTHVGDGSTVLFSFTFPYINESDVKVSLDDVDTTLYSFNNATTIQFTTAPAASVAIRIYRSTNNTDVKSAFFAGSSIKAKDLNDNFTQSLYVVQEAIGSAGDASTNAANAVTTANTALTNSSAAVTTANSTIAIANTSNTNSAAAVVTANASNATSATAASDAASAVVTAGTASTNASAAVVTANAADANATTALNNSRESDGSGGFTTAIAKATTALSTATTSSTDSSAAVVTANAASSSAATALSTANAASAAVSSAVLFTLIANVAAVPGSPSNNDYVEMGNSTGVESFSPLSGVPSGFVGHTGLTVRLRYETSSTSWVWMSYFANDSETRYVSQDNTSANLPTGTTVQRPSSPAAGMLRFNSTDSKFEGYDGSGWGEIGGGIATIDAGNFNTGGSLVSTTETYDGGSFD